MDSVALLRAVPTSTGLQADSILGLARPEISWQVDAERDSWVLGDLFDRLLVGDLPLSALLEFRKVQVDGGEDLTIYGLHTSLERVRFHKTKGIVSMVLERVDSRSERVTTKYSTRLYTIMNDYKLSAATVTLRACTSDGAFLTYKPFTHRMLFARAGGLAIGDASLRPAAVHSSIEEDMELQNIGICFNRGIWEHVYSMEIDGQSWPLSTNEVKVVLAACNSDVDRCKGMAKALKEFCSYMSMRYRDMNEGEVMLRTRGRRVDVDEAESLTNTMFVSGEIDIDVDEGLVDIVRSRNDEHTLVWVDRLNPELVQVVFRGSHHMTRITTEWVAANRELAILEELDRDKLVNAESTGLVQMAAGMQPEGRVKQYGSGLNPRIQTDENGCEVHLDAVNGIFSTCASCDCEVCNINGLVAKVQHDSQSDASVYHVQWQDKHTYTGHEYHNYALANGSRIA